MHEAKIDETEHGRMPADDGWFILNLRDVAWATVEGGGAWAAWETRESASKTLGWGVHVLWPGDSPGYYHAESQQEGFLVLSGQCIAIVEGEERPMGPGDFLHSPPGTGHIIVGAGDGPCALVMVGTRAPDNEIQYLVDPVAARHGWSVEQQTDSPREAYKDRPPIKQTRSPWPLDG
jgi:uncharacterized cupin superfamily protein